VTTFRPFAKWEEDVLQVRLGESQISHSIEVECVVDLTYVGDLVGIEILDLSRQLSGGTALAQLSDSDVRWSYDSEMDAFYLHVSDGRGQVQRAQSGIAHLNREDQLVGIDVACV
jgi:uncharacterized protein YuzE